MSRPGWDTLDINSMSVLDEIVPRLPETLLPLVADPEQSSALGINSNNFRLKTVNGSFVLKRWSDQALPRDVQITLAIMDLLASRQQPVPAPVELHQGSFTLSIGSGKWSLFPFVEGEYFSGSDDELRASAEATGRLMDTLTLLPARCLPSEGPAQMTAADRELLCRVNDVSKNWDALLGAENAELLALAWPVLMAEWEALSGSNLVSGTTQAAHFDLHPHNLIMSQGKVAAVLDFEACKLMPVGFAIGFAALKQCRQAMTLRPLVDDPRLVGSLYVDHLLLTCPIARQFATHLGDLAVAEVLRRICIILRLNLDTGEKKWNKVLGVQLRHLGEARALFG
jgi:hypothetical protein